MTDLSIERLRQIIDAAGKFEHTPWRYVTDPDEFDTSADVVDALDRIVCTTDIRHGKQIALADPATIAAMAGEIVRLRAIPGLVDVVAGKATIVPVEATAEMRHAAFPEDYGEWHSPGVTYNAMLAATPYRRPTDDRDTDN